MLAVDMVVDLRASAAYPCLREAREGQCAIFSLFFSRASFSNNPAMASINRSLVIPQILITAPPPPGAFVGHTALDANK